MEPIVLNLVNLKGGAAMERFDEALGKAIENILDPNTSTKFVREIRLLVKIKPNEDRGSCSLGLEVSTKLSPPRAVGSVIYVGQVAGKFIAAEHNINQLPLFQPEEPTAFPKVVKE